MTKGNVPPVLSRYRAANVWKPLRYSNERAKEILGWTPRIGWVEGVTAMAAAAAASRALAGELRT